MTVKFDIYENMPLYSRISDEMGLLQHLTLAVQPEMDEFLRLIDSQYYLFDPRITPGRFLDWLGQLVGLAPAGPYWVGIGMSPEWGESYKRRVIQKAWNYWQIKGTEAGVRQAIDIWLEWERAQDSKYFQIVLPFGKSATSEPPNWWHWTTPYGAHLNQTYAERQHFGSGDIPGERYKPTYHSVEVDTWHWVYSDELWCDRTLKYVDAPEIITHTSHLGPERPWMHMSLTSEEWKKVFPNVYLLNPEMWALHADVSTFGWMDIKPKPVEIEENEVIPRFETITEFQIDGFQFGELFPYATREAQTIQVVQTQTRTYQNSGWQWGGWWTGLGGYRYQLPDTLQVTVNQGIYPGTQWNELWSSAGAPSVTQDDETIEGNGNRSFTYGDPWASGLWWYYGPYVLSTTTTNPGDATGSSPYFSDYQEIVSTVPGAVVTTPGVAGDGWWYRSYYEYTEQVAVDQELPAVPCDLGFEVEIQDGFIEEIVPGVPAIPASQLLERVPEATEQELVLVAYNGVLGFQWNRQWLTLTEGQFPVAVAWTDPTEINSGSIDVSFVLDENFEFSIDVPLGAIAVDESTSNPYEIDFEEPPPVAAVNGFEDPTIYPLETYDMGIVFTGYVVDIDLETENIEEEIVWVSNPLTIRSAYNSYVEDDDYWQSRAYPAIYRTIVYPEHYLIDEPATVALYEYDWWNSGQWWYFSGIPEVPETTALVPNIRTGHMCNTYDNWSTWGIEWLNEYEVPIDLSDSYTLFDIYPTLGEASIAARWSLMIETIDEIYLQQPVTQFWTKNTSGPGAMEERSQALDLEEGFSNLCLEFVIQPKRDTQIRSITLVLKDRILYSDNFEPLKLLDFSESGCFGFRFLLPMQIPVATPV